MVLSAIVKPRVRLAATLVAATLWAGAGAARADEKDNSWWYETLGVPQAQAEGITGAGVPVAVIGGVIYPDLPVLADAHLKVHQPSMCFEPDDPDWSETSSATGSTTEIAHDATNWVALIAGNGVGEAAIFGVAPDADLRFYATENTQADSYPADYCQDAEGATARAIVQAVDDGARIVLLGRAREPGAKVAQAVAYAVHEDVILVVPVEADEKAWFGSLNGVVSVWDSTEYGSNLQDSKTTFAPTTVTAPGFWVTLQGSCGIVTLYWEQACLGPDGSHYAAAMVAGALADVAQKWPQATNNQLVQTLVRNTGPDDHDLVYTDPAVVYEGTKLRPVGYGPIDLPHMLRVDPTGYEDVNPLIVPDDGQEMGLTAQDIRDARRPAWADDPAESPTVATGSPSPKTPDPDPGTTTMPEPVWWVAATVGIIIAAGTVALLVRRKTSHDNDHERTHL